MEEKTKMKTQKNNNTTTFTEHLWEVDLSELPWWKRPFIRISRIILGTVSDIRDGQLSLHAMSLVYTTIISVVPLLALSFSVSKGLGAHNEIKPAILNILEPLGEKRIEISEKVVQFIDNIEVGVLGTVGLALLVYTVISMIRKIERSFNYVWHVGSQRRFTEQFSRYLSVLVIGPVLIFASIGMTTSLSSHTTVDYLNNLPYFTESAKTASTALPYIIMVLAFGFVYTFIPNTSVSIKSAFVGAVITTIAWKGMGLLFHTLVQNSSQQTAIYSAFASVIILMIWLYVAWLILLIGGSIAYHHQNPNNMPLKKGKGLLSNRVKEKLSLVICYLIGKHFEQDDKEPWTVEKLAAHMHIPINIIEKVIDALEEAQLVVQSNTSPPTLLLTRPVYNINVNDIIEETRKAEEKGTFPLNRIRSEKAVDDFFDQGNKVVATAFDKLTLAGLIAKEAKKEVALAKKDSEKTKDGKTSGETVEAYLPPSDNSKDAKAIN